MPINTTHSSVSAPAADFSAADAHTEKPKKEGGFKSLLKHLNCCHVSLSDTDKAGSPKFLSPSSSFSSDSYFSIDFNAPSAESSLHGKKDAANQASTSKPQYSEEQVKQSLTLLIDRHTNSHDPHLSSTYQSMSAKDIVNTTVAAKNSTPGAEQLTDSEYLGLRLYSTSLYRPINHHLRYAHKDDVPPVVDAMVSGLKKLAKNPNHLVDGHVYRGVAKRMSEAELEQRFKAGHVYRDEAFMSASYNEVVADKFTNHIMFRIQSKTGVDLKDISCVPDEQEALFAPNTPFLVENVLTAPTSPPTWVVDLQELDPDVAADIENMTQNNKP